MVKINYDFSALEEDIDPILDDMEDDYGLCEESDPDWFCSDSGRVQGT